MNFILIYFAGVPIAFLLMVVIGLTAEKDRSSSAQLAIFVIACAVAFTWPVTLPCFLIWCGLVWGDKMLRNRSGK